MRRVALVLVAFLTALLLQSTLFADARLFGARPELIVLVTILVALAEGPNAGAVAGFAGGMWQDLLGAQTVGVTALVLTFVGAVVGTLRQYIVSESPYIPASIVGVGTFLAILTIGFVQLLLGQFEVSAAYLLRVAALSGVYGAVLTPLVAPLVRRILGSKPRATARRW